MNLEKHKYKGVISNICEAFSMQPATMYVGMDYRLGIKLDRIVEEDIYIEGDPFSYYVGYDNEGHKLFEFKKGTVNVCYE